MIASRTTSKLQPLDVAVNKPLKDFVKRRYEDFKLNQFFNSNISQNVVIQSPTRDNVIMDVVEFLKNDKSGISGWKKIVFFMRLD